MCCAKFRVCLLWISLWTPSQVRLCVEFVKPTPDPVLKIPWFRSVDRKTFEVLSCYFVSVRFAVGYAGLLTALWMDHVQHATLLLSRDDEVFGQSFGPLNVVYGKLWLVYFKHSAAVLLWSECTEQRGSSDVCSGGSFSNLARDTDYVHRGFSWFSSVR